jgi:hypothetical protein
MKTWPKRTFKTTAERDPAATDAGAKKNIRAPKDDRAGNGEEVSTVEAVWPAAATAIGDPIAAIGTGC